MQHNMYQQQQMAIAANQMAIQRQQHMHMVQAQRNVYGMQPQTVMTTTVVQQQPMVMNPGP